MVFSFSALPSGGEDPMEREPEVQPGPTPAERRAFRLLPVVWSVVLVLAGIILYAVFR
jgi:hypothetical protein